MHDREDRVTAHVLGAAEQLDRGNAALARCLLAAALKLLLSDDDLRRHAEQRASLRPALPTTLERFRKRQRSRGA